MIKNTTSYLVRCLLAGTTNNDPEERTMQDEGSFVTIMKHVSITLSLASYGHIIIVLTTVLFLLELYILHYCSYSYSTS
jgi:hypothetical protein